MQYARLKAAEQKYLVALVGPIHKQMEKKKKLELRCFQGLCFQASPPVRWRSVDGNVVADLPLKEKKNPKHNHVDFDEAELYALCLRPIPAEVSFE